MDSKNITDESGMGERSREHWKLGHDLKLGGRAVTLQGL